MSKVYVFRYDASGADFDGDSSHVEHVSSDVDSTVYRWTVPSDWDNREILEILVVGGGGGGGRASGVHRAGAGGGGGGVIYSRSIWKEDVVDNDGKVDIRVGSGGDSSETRDEPRQGPGFDGKNSSFGPYTAFGGGGGASTDSGPSEGGGSGGGGNVKSDSGTVFGGRSMQAQSIGRTSDGSVRYMGFAGGFNINSDTSSSRGAGGGGALGAGGGVASNGSGDGFPGGKGFETEIESGDRNNTKIYGAGGGGGRRGSGNAGGIGGDDSNSGAGDGGSPHASDGVSHRGGGGGGGGTDSGGTGGKGGSGVVVVRRGRVVASELLKAQKNIRLQYLIASGAQELYSAVPSVKVFNKSFDHETNGVAVSNSNSIVTARKDGGVSRSTDFGDSWSSVFSPSSSDEELLGIVYISEVHAFYAAGNNKTLLRSVDDGETWSNVASELPSQVDLDAHLDGIAFDRTSDLLEVRGTNDSGGGEGEGEPFTVVSHDFGSSWEYVDLTRPHRLVFSLFQGGSSSGSGGVRLLNTDDEMILGFFLKDGGDGSWNVDDGDGTAEIYTGDGSERWISVELTLDWGDSTYTYRVTDPESGSSESISTGRPFKSVSSTATAERLALAGYSTTDSAWASGVPLHMWLADVQASYDYSFGDEDKTLYRSDHFFGGVLDLFAWTIGDDDAKIYGRDHARPSSASEFVMGIESSDTDKVDVAVASVPLLLFGREEKSTVFHFATEGRVFRLLTDRSYEISSGEREDAGEGDIPPEGTFRSLAVLDEVEDTRRRVDDSIRLVGYVGLDDGSGSVLRFNASTLESDSADAFSLESSEGSKAVDLKVDKGIFVAYASGNVYKLDRSGDPGSDAPVPVGSVYVGADLGAHCLQLSTQNRTLYVGDADGRVHAININTMLERDFTFDGHVSGVTSMSLSPDDRLLFVGHADGILHKLAAADLTTGGQVDTSSGGVTATAFYEGYLYVGKNDGQLLKIRSNDLGTDASASSFTSSKITAIAEPSRARGPPMSIYIYVASEDGSVYQVDLDSLSVQHTLTDPHSGSIVAVAAVPRRRRDAPFILTAGTNDNKIMKASRKDVSDVMDDDLSLSAPPLFLTVFDELISWHR